MGNCALICNTIRHNGISKMEHRCELFTCLGMPRHAIPQPPVHVPPKLLKFCSNPHALPRPLSGAKESVLAADIYRHSATYWRLCYGDELLPPTQLPTLLTSINTRSTLRACLSLPPHSQYWKLQSCPWKLFVPIHAVQQSPRSCSISTANVCYFSNYYLICQHANHFSVYLKPTNELQFFWLTSIYFVINCILLRQICFPFSMLYYVCTVDFTLDAGLPARSQYSESPATGHLDTGIPWFHCVYKQILRWFPRFQVATTCFSFSPPDLNLLVKKLKQSRYRSGVAQRVPEI